MGTLSSLQFADVDTLLDRLDGATDPVLILGSALCAPVVPGVADLTRMVQAAAARPRQKRRMDAALQGVTRATDRYQAALQALIASAGLSAANAVIQKAVLSAYTGANPAAARATEDDLDHWTLTPGLEALGRWIAARTDRVTILTTNFDPLIQIAIRRAGGRCFSTVLTVDGRLQASHGEGAHIVHVHGDWLDDTLHTPTQLKAPRPYLHQSLQAACRRRLVAVLAYGGWDDAITRALWDLAFDAQAGTDVLWTFYSDDPADIAAQSAHIFDGLEAVVPGRTFFFKGVDVHRVLAELTGDVPAPSPPPPTPVALALPFPPEIIEQLIEWSIEENLYARRPVLLGALPKALTANLELSSMPVDQLRLDLMAFNTPARQHAGQPVMALWLAQAARMAIGAASTAGFERCLRQVQA
jgi:hypothetical protein